MAQITIMLIPLAEWAEQNAVNMATARKYAQQRRIIGIEKRDGFWVVPSTSPVPARGKTGRPKYSQRFISVVTVDNDPQDEHRDAY